MGNQASAGLPFNVGDAVYTLQRPVPWLIHHGSKKDSGLEVSVFRLNKQAAGVGPSAMAQHAVQKLRTLRHPNILTYIDSAELEDAVVLVTERICPLRSWLESLQEAYAMDQLCWGFKCLGNAVSFLQTKCSMLHGAVTLDAIFVRPNGDWVLGGMELIVALPSEKLYFTDRETVIQEQYRSPERRARNWAILEEPELAVRMDTYSLGKVVEEIFSLVSVPASKPLTTLMQRMTRDNPAQRILMQQFMKCPAFDSEYVKLMTSLEELSIKSPLEQTAILAELSPKLVAIPPGTAVSKIAPILLRVIELASADYNTNREAGRTAIGLALPSLAQVTHHIPDDVFRRSYQGVLMPLWNLNDRTVRSALLQTLKPMVSKLDDDAINKKLLDAMLNGFADSAVKMRELTLKSLVHITDRLDERALNDKLLRCLNKLQSDPEASIRTNTTIFVGKIAAKLKPDTRARALPPTFLKAMKDPFSHARLAGVKATQACLGFFDNSTLALKFLPALACLAVDKSGSVRDISLQCCETILAKLKEAHEEASKQEEQQLAKKQAEARAKQSAEINSLSGAAADTAVNTITSSGLINSRLANDTSSDGWSSIGTASAASAAGDTRGSPSVVRVASVGSFDGWEDFDEDGLSPDDLAQAHSGTSDAIGDGWGEEEEEWDWDADHGSRSSPVAANRNNNAEPRRPASQHPILPQPKAADLPSLQPKPPAPSPSRSHSLSQPLPPTVPHQLASRVPVPTNATNVTSSLPAQRSSPPNLQPRGVEPRAQAKVLVPSAAPTPVSAPKEVKGMKLGAGSDGGAKKKERVAVKKLNLSPDDWDDF